MTVTKLVDVERSVPTSDTFSKDRKTIFIDNQIFFKVRIFTVQFNISEIRSCREKQSNQSVPAS